MAEAKDVTGAENKPEAVSTGRFGGRGRMIAAGAVVFLAVVAFFVWRSSGQQSTDDAQIDGHITQVSSRVGGTVVTLSFQDNQLVKAGDVLVELDPRDYQVAVDRAKAELADAQANAAAAKSGIPITEVSTSTGTRSATGGLEEAQAGVGMADSQIEAARAQLVAAQARQREREATATKAARDVERLKGLVVKEEIPQQQFDAAVAASESARAAADAAHSEAAAAETAIAVAEQRARQSRGTAAQAQAAVQATRSAPQQMQVTRARAAMADARVQQSQAALAQAELNLRAHARQGAVVGRGEQEERGSRAGRAVRPAAARAGLPGRRLGHGQLQGDPAEKHARRAAGDGLGGRAGA